jgi:hypothetical protein
VATGKYVDILLAHFGKRLRFPADFVGARGHESRRALAALRRGPQGAALHFSGGRCEKRKAAGQAGAAKI